MDLTEAQWEVVKPLVQERRREDGRGNPWCDSREVLNGILWVLRTSAPWRDLPTRYPSYKTCHHRFQELRRSGRLSAILRLLLKDLVDRGQIGLGEEIIDAIFSAAKTEALQLVERSAAKGAMSWQLQTAKIFLSPCTWPVLRPTKTNL